MVDCTNTSLFEKHYWKRSSFNLTVILPIYVAILITCITGNSIVCATIIGNRHMRSRWYFFLLNLAIADMGFALTTPMQLLQFVKIDLGDIGCKSGIFILDIFVGVSLLSLAFISLDRYFGICTSGPSHIGERTAKPIVVVPLVWLAAAILYLPMVFACQRSRNSGSLACDCHSKWPEQKYYAMYAFFVTFVIYFIPFSSMAVCYFKICRKLWFDHSEMIAPDPLGTKKKSIKMLVATTIIFFIAWTPYNCLYVLKKLEAIDPKTFGKLFLLAQVLAFANSGLNPFIYCIFSKNFRQGFKNCCCWRRKRRSAKRTFTSDADEKSRLLRESERSRGNDTGYGGSISS